MDELMALDSGDNYKQSKIKKEERKDPSPQEKQNLESKSTSATYLDLINGQCSDGNWPGDK